MEQHLKPVVNSRLIKGGDKNKGAAGEGEKDKPRNGIPEMPDTCKPEVEKPDIHEIPKRDKPEIEETDIEEAPDTKPEKVPDADKEEIPEKVS